MISTIVSPNFVAGMNNKFLVRAKDPRSIIYNDQSPLENHHCSMLFQILSFEEYNIFENISASDYAVIKKSIVKSILHTDMAVHNNNVEAFKELRVKLNQSGSNITQDDTNTLVATLLHAMDINNGTLEYSNYYRWGLRVV